MKWLDASLQPFFSPGSAKRIRAKIDKRKELAANVNSLINSAGYLKDVSHNFIYLFVARKGIEAAKKLVASNNNRKDFMANAKKILNKGM